MERKWQTNRFLVADGSVNKEGRVGRGEAKGRPGINAYQSK